MKESLSLGMLQYWLFLSMFSTFLQMEIGISTGNYLISLPISAIFVHSTHVKS